MLLWSPGEEEDCLSLTCSTSSSLADASDLRHRSKWLLPMPPLRTISSMSTRWCSAEAKQISIVDMPPQWKMYSPSCPNVHGYRELLQACSPFYRRSQAVKLQSKTNELLALPSLGFELTTKVQEMLRWLKKINKGNCNHLNVYASYNLTTNPFDFMNKIANFLKLHRVRMIDWSG